MLIYCIILTLVCAGLIINQANHGRWLTRVESNYVARFKTIETRYNDKIAELRKELTDMVNTGKADVTEVETDATTLLERRKAALHNIVKGFKDFFDK